MFVVGVVGREVGPPDEVVDALTRPPDHADDVVAFRELLHLRADRLHHAQAFVAEHEKVRSRGRSAVPGLVDLAIGAVQPEAEDPDEHAAAAGDFVETGFGQLLEVNAAGLSGINGYSLHPY